MNLALRLAAIAAVCWLLVIVQTSAAPAFPLLGVGPNLLLAVLCCWAVERPPGDAVFAVAVSGVLMGLLAFQGMTESVAAFAPIALAAVWTERSRLPDRAVLRWPVVIALAAAASFLHFIVLAVAVELETSGVNWIEAMRDVMLPGLAANAIVAAVVYWPARWTRAVLARPPRERRLAGP